MQILANHRGTPVRAAGRGRQGLQLAQSTRVYAVHAQKSCPEAISAVADEVSSSSKRELVAGLVSLSAVALLPGVAAAAGSCEFISSPSGLQFCDVQPGDGPEPVKGSLIRCHYTGRLASNNRVFDSSYERRRPLTFKVGVHEVISGWDLGILGTEGIPPMKEGGKRILLIPSDLGYGSRGAGGVIPPNADLLFEVELLGKPGRR